MWEIVAIVKVLERKGLCTKQDLYDIITEFRSKNPRAPIPETAFPEPYLLTETENKIIDDILELLNKNGLTSHQSMNLLELRVLYLDSEHCQDTSYDQSGVRDRWGQGLRRPWGQRDRDWGIQSPIWLE